MTKKGEIIIDNRVLRRKFAIAARIVIIFFVIAILRLVYIQFIQSDKLQGEIIEDRVREIVNLPERGTITDRKGNILAMSLITNDIAVHPNLIVSKKHQENVAKVLSENVEGLKYDEVLKIVQSDEKWKLVAKKVSAESAKKIRESKIGGIQISQSPVRLYPNGALAGGILGFVNDNNDPGAGLELKLNNFLAGQKGYTLAEINPFGKIIPVGSQNAVSPTNGQNINTTIDSYIQNILEENLLLAAEELQPKEIHAVLMDPNNGEIIAMASYPSYDPNNYQDFDKKTYTNTPANFGYEPGSIFKPFIIASALESGGITGDEYVPSGSMVVNGHLIRDWNRGNGWGSITIEQIIQHSSNIGMIHVGKTMSDTELIDSLKKHGFNSPTGVELPGETIGFNFPTEKALQDDPIRRANISFGQGILMNPIQLVTSFSEIINGGFDIQPTLIKNVKDENGNIIYEPNKPTTRAWKEDTAEKVRGYLKNNMEIGSGADLQIEGFDGGGKTGSAWFVEDGVYKDGAIIGSFMGFLPFENPKYALLISVKEPQGVEFGSTSAGPTYQRVMSEVVRYAGLKPTVISEEKEEEQKPTFNLKDYSWTLFKDASKDIENTLTDNVKVTQVGKGEVVVNQTYTYENNVLHISLHTKPIVDKDTYYIPDLIGKKKEEIEALFKPYKLNYHLYGNNKVTEQTIAPGQHFKIKSLQLWCN